MQKLCLLIHTQVTNPPFDDLLHYPYFKEWSDLSTNCFLALEFIVPKLFLSNKLLNQNAIAIAYLRYTILVKCANASSSPSTLSLSIYILITVVSEPACGHLGEFQGIPATSH